VDECWKQVELKGIAEQVNAEQLEMLYDYVRARYLFAPAGNGGDLFGIWDQVAWMVNVAQAKLDCKVENGVTTVLNTPPAMYRLYQAASAVYQNLSQGKNIFGHDSSYAILGNLMEYQNSVHQMAANWEAVEDWNQKEIKFQELATKAAADWSRVKNAADAVATGMEEKKTRIKKILPDTSAAIRAKEEVRNGLRTTLNGYEDEFKAEIDSKFGLKWQDFFGILNQLSFTNREFSTPSYKDDSGKVIPSKFMLGGALATGAMLVSQLGDLAAKGIENVVTDSGEQVSKKQIIKSVKALGATIQTCQDFKQQSSGFIWQDPNSEARLLAAREQLDRMLEDFYQQAPAARKISDTLSAYVDAVQERNAKVDEWNQLMVLYAHCDAELKNARAQSAAVDANRPNDPGLAARARFSTSLNRHALEVCVETLYEAGRALTLHTLQDFDVFSKLVGVLDTSSGIVNSATLKAALNDYIQAVLKSGQRIGDRSRFQVSVRLTPKTHALVFALLKKGRPATFLLAPADARAVLPDSPLAAEHKGKVTPFAGMADIRLTGIQPAVFVPIGNPLETRCKKYSIQLKHSGEETFFTPEGEQVVLSHLPMEKTFRYDEEENREQRKTAALDPEHSEMIGAFPTSWQIAIPPGNLVYRPGENVDGLESIVITFEGTYIGFTMGATERANAPAGAAGSAAAGAAH
jgi:uncharacterized Ntn-hydrolase superfamily protein